MSYNPPKGPGKGPGNGNTRPPRTPEQMREMTRAREIKREWRKEHPEWQPKPEMVSKKQIRDYIMGAVPDMIDKAVQIALDDTHPKQVEALKIGIEQGIGKAPQAVEITGENGGALKLIQRIELVPVEPEQKDAS